MDSHTYSDLWPSEADAGTTIPSRFSLQIKEVFTEWLFTLLLGVGAIIMPPTPILGERQGRFTSIHALLYSQSLRGEIINKFLKKILSQLNWFYEWNAPKNILAYITLLYICFFLS